MRKLLIIAAIVGLIFGSAYAVDIDAGIEIDALLNRDISGENSGLEGELSGQNYDVVAKIPLGDYITLSPKVGLSYLNIETDVLGTEVNLESGLGYNLGIDAVANVYKGKVDVDLIGSYQYTRVDINEIEIGAISLENPLETILNLNEWELGVKVSKDLCEYTNIPLTPYIGLVYSDAVGNIDTNLSLINLEEDIKAEDHIGLRLGISATPKENLVISLEGKLLDQQAVIASVTYKF